MLKIQVILFKVFFFNFYIYIPLFLVFFF
eukprot:UN09455